MKSASSRWIPKMKAILAISATLSIGVGVFLTDSTAESFVGHAKNPLANLLIDDAEVRTGEVHGRLQTGSYTYLRVKPQDADPFWSVVLGAGPARGSQVRIIPYGKKKNFHSPRLNRVFDELIFGKFVLISNKENSK